MRPKYIKFNGKHPAQTKDNREYANKPKAGWQSYGAAYGQDFLKVDIDDYTHSTGEIEEAIHGKPRSEAIISILEYLKIRYNGIKTEHGKHLFFRVPEWMEQKNKVNWYCPLCVRMEWKFPASDDHIPLKINGVSREFFKGAIDNEDIDELPPFLYPLQKSRGQGKTKGSTFDLDFPEGNRTQKLGAYLFFLVQNKKYSVEQAFQIVELMNRYIFEKPIPQSTLEAQILNDSTRKKLQEQQREKNLNHSDVAKEIIGKFDLITVNGELYAYEGGVYKPFSDGKITNYLTGQYPKLTGNFEREVIRHIKGLTYTEYAEDDGLVNVRNGVLQFDEKGKALLLPHSKSRISFKQFNAIYEPDAKSPALDETLFKVFNGNIEQMKLFNQVLGYLLMDHVRYQKVFFFVGMPSTGKTTILMLIRNFCGKENVSSIQLDDFGRAFGLAPLVNKTANIFSDIKKTKVLSSDTFKMLADGSPVTINPKHKAQFSYCFTGKLLFGMNNFPDFSNDMSGIERRLVIFEFKHLFLKGSAEYDPFIDEKLHSDESMSALLNRAIDGYKSLIANNGFTDTPESVAALAAFAADNDNVMRWLHESEVTMDYLLHEPIKTDAGGGLYREYQEFCYSIGEEPKAQKDFSRTICGKYGFETHTKRFQGKRWQFFREK